MANAFSPTAANILASLGIRGATTGERLADCKQGFVPVLGENGKLSANLIPANSAQLAIPALSDVAFVDPYTTVPEADRKGSVVAPFVSLSEAAARFEQPEGSSGTFVAILAPGEHSDTSVEFERGFPSSVYVIGLGGGCTFVSGVRFSGLLAGANVVLQGISTSEKITVSCDTPSVTCIGSTSIGELAAPGSFSVFLSPDSRVYSTQGAVTYLADAFHVGNAARAGESSPAVKGATVGDALERLGTRKIRVSNIGIGSSGIDIGSSSYADIPAVSGGSGFDIFDMRERDRALVNALNEAIARAETGQLNEITATTVNADVVNAREFHIDALTLGGYSLEVDNLGYLVVEQVSDSAKQPPEALFVIRDSVDGALYVLGIAAGRLYVKPFDESGQTSSDSSSADGILDEIDVEDSETSRKYAITMRNGTLVLTLENE